MNQIFSLLIVLFTCPSLLAKDSVRILFVYGSKPKIEGESRWFGGIHGGHVSVEHREGFVSFLPAGKFHVFPKDSFHSVFEKESGDYFVFDTAQNRYLLLSIPVDSWQRKKLDSVCEARLKQAPYDYAFFGMRCASAAYEILSVAGIFPKRSRAAMVRAYFYPKRLRKELLRHANKNSWSRVYHTGRTSRKWEKD